MHPTAILRLPSGECLPLGRTPFVSGPHGRTPAPASVITPRQEAGALSDPFAHAASVGDK